MATIYYEKDADLSQLKNEKVAIVGYGARDMHMPRNLKESGLSVVVPTFRKRTGSGGERWSEVKTVAEAAAEAQ